MANTDSATADLEERLADALDELAQRDRHMEVLENFIAGLEKDYAQTVHAATELGALRSKVLDLEDALTRAEATNEVMENFCFGLERDHAEAREIAERLEADRQEIFATIDQGLFTIAADGSVNEGWSHATERMLGSDLSGRRLSEIFDPAQREAIDRFVTLIFTPRAQDPMLRRLSPLAKIWHAADGREPRLLACRVTRIKDGADRVVKALIEVNDRTEQHRVERELDQRTQAHATRIERLYSILTLPDGAYADFEREAQVVLQAVLACRAPHDALGVVLQVHSLKGAALALGLEHAAALCHDLEAVLTDNEGVGAPWVQRLQTMVDGLQAEVREGADLVRRAHRSGAGRAAGRPVAERMELSLSRLADHEARASHKRVAMHCEIRDLEDQPEARLRTLSRALVQGVRNAVAHGLESPAERVAAGKLPCGTISVEVRANATLLLATCADDGRGIDRSALRRQAQQMGLTLSPDPDADHNELAFHPGLSTAGTVTAQAGRGVGMSVIRAAMAELGGRASLHAGAGRGTELRLEVPLGTAAQTTPDRGPNL